VRNGARLKGGFLADEAGGEHGVEIVAFGFAAQCGLIRQRKRGPSRVQRNILDARASKFETAMRP